MYQHVSKLRLELFHFFFNSKKVLVNIGIGVFEQDDTLTIWQSGRGALMLVSLLKNNFYYNLLLMSMCGGLDTSVLILNTKTFQLFYENVKKIRVKKRMLTTASLKNTNYY